MKKTTVIATLSGVVIFSIGLATGLTAQTLTDSPQRKEQKRTDLTGAPNMEVIASIVEIKSGESSNLHIHHGVEAFHVLQGAAIQVPGQEPSALPTGLTSLNLRDVKHGAFKVLGDTPLKLLTIHRKAIGGNMAQLETRIKKLEAQMIPPKLDGLIMFLEFIPAVNGKVCSEYEKRGIQTATCDGNTFSRETGESEETFRERVSGAVTKPGTVAHVVLEKN